MRRKSTRNTQKASPEKVVKESETPPKTRRSRRRKRSPSKSSESDEETAKRTSPPPEETPDTTTKSHTPSDEETIGEPVWKVTQTEEDTPKGEVQKLKICLTRPSPDSPDKNKLRRSKSSSQTEDDGLEDKLTRRTRSHGSPSIRNDDISSQEGDEDVDEKKGKGKSKGKHKSKIEKSSHLSEPEIQTNNEISENVQVTPQSPTINKPNDNENDYNKVDADKIDNENIQRHDESISEESVNKVNDDSDKIQVSEVVSNTENNDSDDDEEPLSKLQKMNTASKQETTDTVSEIQQENIPKLDNETSQESSTKLENFTDTENQREEDVLNQQPPPDNQSEETLDKTKSPIHIMEQSSNNIVTEENVTTEPEVLHKKEEFEKTKEEFEGSLEEKTADSDNLTNKTSETEDILKSVDETVPVTMRSSDSKQKTPAVRSPRHWLKRDNTYLKQDTEDKDHTDETGGIRPKQVKRKWGNSIVETPPIKVDLESIQTVWPTIEFPEEPDLNVDVKERRKSISDTVGKKNERKVSVEYKSDFSERPSFEKQSSVSSSTQDNEDNSNIIAFNRKISIVDDTASKLKPPPSPAKNPISNTLYITNLVRPFTVKQLKELLERTGKIQEEGFWTDRIKSKCYVQYETQEEAEATRNALHGVQWPIGNGKKLIIDYGTEEDMNNAKNPPAPQPTIPVQETKIAIKENLEPGDSKPPRIDERELKEMEKRRSEGPVREWDIGKKDIRRDRSRSRERSRKHKRSRSPSIDFIARKHKKEEESVPQKLMDDLFLKTKATPSIYWQPLSPEEIAMKQQQRLMRMEEHKRRLEESSRMKAREIGRGAFRRRYD